VTAFTVPLSNLTAAAPSFSAVDTLLDIRAADGSIIATSDDAGSDAYGVGSVGPVRGSAVRYEATAAGTLYLSVRGFSSEDVGAYALAVSICDVPTPGTASAFVLAGLPLVRRRATLPFHRPVEPFRGLSRGPVRRVSLGQMDRSRRTGAQDHTD
jgi:hypothetical protein